MIVPRGRGELSALMAEGFYWELKHPNYEREGLRWYEWGAEGHDFFAAGILPAILSYVAGEVGLAGLRRNPPKRFEELDIEASRLPARRLAELESIFGAKHVSSSPRERVFHSAGRSYFDVLRLRRGELKDYVDGVVYPTQEAQIARLFAWAAEARVGLIPFGGGSSVVGGLEVVRREKQKAVISVDMTRMHALLDFDATDRTALFEAGIYGPMIERKLNAMGWTLGHFPQSFEYSTLGGWVAARSAGQQSNRYGKMEDLLVTARMVSPAGVVQTARVPAAATGPEWNEIVAGSEGLLGLITQVRVRVHELPEERRYFGLLFPTFEAATGFLRDAVRAEIPTAMMRLSDASETRLLQMYSRLGRGRSLGARLKGLVERGAMRVFSLGETPTVALIGLEGDRRSNNRNQSLVRGLMRAHGGMYGGQKLGHSWMRGRFNMPFLRRHFMDNGIGVDTFETAVPFSQVRSLHEAVLARCAEVIPGCRPMCHISHSYHDGVCMYFTVIFEMDQKRPAEQWARFKRAVSQTIVDNGGNISHHHGVGTDHKKWYVAETGDAAISALRAMKGYLDAAGLLNAGKLFDGAK